MISEREKYERFENYLKGLLDLEAKAAFDKDLKEHEELSREFEDYRQAHQLIFEGGLLDLRQELDTLHAAQLKKGRFRNRVKNIVISAGILVTGILLYVYLNRYNELNPEKSSLNQADKKVENAAVLSEKERGEIAITDMYEDKTTQEKSIIDSSGEQVTELTILSPAVKSGDKGYKPVNIMAKTVSVTPVEEKISLTVSMPADTSALPKSNLTENENKSRVPLPDCEQVSISCEFITENTCSNGSQGRIIFFVQSLRGGYPPYEFSINGGAVFESQPLFDNLQGGNYQLAVRDANQCVSAIGNTAVLNIECDFRFAPGMGEVWEIPFVTDKNGKLLIYSKEGKLLYSAGIGQSFDRTWSGKSLDGDILPMGVYLFRLEFPEGRRREGTVTIIK